MRTARLLTVLTLGLFLSGTGQGSAEQEKGERTKISEPNIKYIFTTFEVPGASSTEASGINNAGNIVGDFRAGDREHGYLKIGRKFFPFDVPGAKDTFAVGINNFNDIVGFFSDVEGAQHGYVKVGAKFSRIDVKGAVQTNALAINARGQVVGLYANRPGEYHGFLKEGSSFATIDVPGATYTVAAGINARGQIVGYYGDSSGQQHGFLMSGFADIPDESSPFTTIDFPDATITSAAGINDVGLISGTFDDSEGASHAYVTDGSFFTRLDVPEAEDTFAVGINNFGRIVGLCYPRTPSVNVIAPNAPIFAASCSGLNRGYLATPISFLIGDAGAAIAR